MSLCQMLSARITVERITVEEGHLSVNRGTPLSVNRSCGRWYLSDKSVYNVLVHVCELYTHGIRWKQRVTSNWCEFYV